LRERHSPKINEKDRTDNDKGNRDCKSVKVCPHSKERMSEIPRCLIGANIFNFIRNIVA
jgi:hypothetical protein